MRSGIPRLHTKGFEIGTRLLLDMVSRSPAEDFVIARLHVSPKILLLEVAPNAEQDGRRTNSARRSHLRSVPIWDGAIQSAAGIAAKRIKNASAG
jgi:hypothetical protein